MNITLSIDETLVARAREIAARQGTSLNALIRQHLETLVGESPGDEVADELLLLMEESGGRSGGRRFRRDEAYEERL